MKKFLAGGIVLLAVGMFNLCAYADDPVVGPGKKVTLDYTLTVDNKQVETSVGKTPLSYVVGARNIIPGLESQINGRPPLLNVEAANWEEAGLNSAPDRRLPGNIGRRKPDRG